MEKKIKVYKQITEINDILCDCCGKSCKTSLGFEYLDLKTTWGYDSKKDSQEWSAQICEKCVDEKLGFINFKIKNND